MTLPEPDAVRVLGDWHGATAWGQTQIAKTGMVAKIPDAEGKTKRVAMIVVGDFGYWIDNDWTDLFLSTVNTEAEEWGIDFYFLDGNHEDHDRVAKLNATEAMPLPGYPNITYLPRGYRWSWWGMTWMAVGGAASVDKHMRTENVDWWAAEELTDQQMAYCAREGKVDIVLAHDCPTGVDIPRVGNGIEFTPSMYFPDEAIRRANVHRARVAHIADAVEPQLWIHGHYHVAYARRRGATLVQGLDCNGSTYGEHAVQLTRKDFE